jgi:hypothetical protein
MVSNDFVTQHNTYLDAGREGQTCIFCPLIPAKNAEALTSSAQQSEISI